LDIAGLLATRSEGLHAYCCGPSRMLDAFAAATSDWPEGTVHVERFTGLDRDAARQGDAFEAEVEGTGQILFVPADRSLLEVLREAGHSVDAACEYGVCGSCVVEVRRGEPVHRDVCLSAEARVGRMTACVSRGKGRLVLAV
jgi:vanillate O-demethylase ferredoxin subunit